MSTGLYALAIFLVVGTLILLGVLGASFFVWLRRRGSRNHSH